MKPERIACPNDFHLEHSKSFLRSRRGKKSTPSHHIFRMARSMGFRAFDISNEIDISAALDPQSSYPLRRAALRPDLLS